MYIKYEIAACCSLTKIKLLKIAIINIFILFINTLLITKGNILSAQNIYEGNNELNVLIEKAELLTKEANYDSTNFYFKKLGRKIYEEGTPDELVKYYLTLCEFLNEVEWVDSALIIAETSITYAQNFFSEHHKYTARAYYNKAFALYLNWQYAEATGYFKKAIRIYDKTSDSADKTVILAHLYLGNSNRYLKKFGAAWSSYRVAIRLSNENDNKFLDKIYNSLGWYYLFKPDYDSAFFYHRKALFIRSKLHKSRKNLLKLAQTYNSFAACSESLGYSGNEIYIDSAWFYHKKSLYIRQKLLKYHPDLFITYTGLACYFLHKKVNDSALYYFQKAIINGSVGFDNMDYTKNPAIGQMMINSYLHTTLISKGDIFFSKYLDFNNINYLKLAKDNYELGAAVNEKNIAYSANPETKEYNVRNKVSYDWRLINLYNELYKSTGDVICLEKAFERSEMNKGYLLTMLLKDEHLKEISGIPAEITGEEKQLNKEIANLERNISITSDIHSLKKYEEELFQKKKEREQFIKKIENNWPLYYDHKHNISTVNLKDI
ncbi:MAG: tetratricopeptide repeat protein [Bacteroidetes bacterium]|nr:tetratricopeptide repeat protein [Bacteroidota bacterium]MBL7105052.1 tetratricopeptide repeat protein [Bacteroidales bacterium]